MSSILSSHSMVSLATAMAVSGTVVLLALRLQKLPSIIMPSHFPLPPSCIISSEEGKKKEKGKKKKKKVHFAENVVDPSGNSEEYRKLHKTTTTTTTTTATLKKGRKVEEIPANRLALYNGILRDRVIHRVAYSC